MASLSILLLGETDRPEFADTLAVDRGCQAASRFTDFASAAAAIEAVRIAPDVVVVAQSFPGQFSHRDMGRLRCLAPLARIVGLIGSWCEGEMRSGSPWPATARLYWHQWPARTRRQLRRLAGGQACSWSLPATATDEERLLADCSSGADIPICHNPGGLLPDYASGADIPVCRSPSGLVAICSPSRELADCLSAVCRSRGLATVWHRDFTSVRVEGATAGIFDAADFRDEQAESLRRFATALRPAPVVALLSFPRIADRRRALSAGAATVLSKPLLVDDLLDQLAVR